MHNFCIISSTEERLPESAVFRGVISMGLQSSDDTNATRCWVTVNLPSSAVLC